MLSECDPASGTVLVVSLLVHRVAQRAAMPTEVVLHRDAQLFARTQGSMRRRVLSTALIQ